MLGKCIKSTYCVPSSALEAKDRAGNRMAVLMLSWHLRKGGGLLLSKQAAGWIEACREVRVGESGGRLASGWYFGGWPGKHSLRSF